MSSLSCPCPGVSIMSASQNCNCRTHHYLDSDSFTFNVIIALRLRQASRISTLGLISTCRHIGVWLGGGVKLSTALNCFDKEQ
jgi:hypothetical protein